VKFAGERAFNSNPNYPRVIVQDVFGGFRSEDGTPSAKLLSRDDFFFSSKDHRPMEVGSDIYQR
jgi:hypothetical protein